jgi:hypothetical protein
MTIGSFEMGDWQWVIESNGFGCIQIQADQLYQSHNMAHLYINEKCKM